VYLEHDASDAVLVARSLEGDSRAFDGLVQRYYRPLFTVAFRMLGNRDDAADATQNAFLKIHQGLARFDGNRRFFSWIYRILVNECLNVRRDRKPFEPLGEDFAAAGSTHGQLETSEQRRLVQSAILALPADYRAVIVLRHFAEMSYEDMSAALEIPVRTVRWRLHAARRQLAQRLEGIKS
jgi:RNA polymerase sigma-70 factor (ECF subfamily)